MISLLLLLLAAPLPAVEVAPLGDVQPIASAPLAPALPTATALPVQLSLPFPQAEVPAPRALATGLQETSKALAPSLATASDARVAGETSASAAAESFDKLRAAGLNVPHALPGATVDALTPRIIHVNFKEHFQLATTFLRFQEHYESPKFRGKVFSHEEYMDWYASTHKGKFSYVEDWGGFNIPSRVLRRFYKGEFDPLWRKERAFLELFRGKKGRFYIIGTSGDGSDEDTLRHEVAHGLFYTVPEYKREVLAILKPLDLRQVFAFLGKDEGYHPRVWLDEAHAYIMSDVEWLGKQGVDVAPLRAASLRLRALFEKHYARAKSGTAAGKARR